MEVMEDGNLMDRVQILIQRDLEYYKQKQNVLQESLCSNVVGGRLDFPRHASFAAVKLVLWWEEEYVAAYRKRSGLMESNLNIEYDDMDDNSRGCGGIIKSSDPNKFVSSITKSADDLLKHLHILTQEALDHADLNVLTGTIGAAALLRNCLWCYMRSTPDGTQAQIAHFQQLQSSHKKYQEMAEALAERLLDLHCRLLSLYILQDADSLDWEDNKAFFESERGSYIVQMWWLYMQGTRENLWNTVPPKMAQRVFAGMLNESLTILSVRYSQARPSQSRSSLYAVDISNILLCVTELLPAICDNTEELIGLAINTQNKIIRDVHAKCQELFYCLLLRGAPLNALHKLFRRGVNSIEFCRTRNTGPSPWFVFTTPYLFLEYPINISQIQDLKPETAVALELKVLLVQPQPNLSQLLKVLLMSNCKVLVFILYEVIQKFGVEPSIKKQGTSSKCVNFLCTGEGLCNDEDYEHDYFTRSHGNSIIIAITQIVLIVGNSQDILKILLPAIELSGHDWAVCFDRRQVWNQKRPAWYEAILILLAPILPSVVSIVSGAVQTGASMYQAMAIILGCFSQLWDCVPVHIPRIASHISDILPSDVHPIGNSVLLQILVSALYSAFINKAESCSQSKKSGQSDNSSKATANLSDVDTKSSTTTLHVSTNSIETILLTLAEGLCSIDEDNKHTDQIAEFLESVSKSLKENDTPTEGCKRVDSSQQMVEILVSDLLFIPEGKKSLKILHQFIYSNHEWIFHKLDPSNEFVEPNRMTPEKQSLLYTMFHIRNKPFDQLLSGDWVPNWHQFLHIPMGLSVERIWAHISMRWEFKDSDASDHDAQIVAKLTSILKES